MLNRLVLFILFLFIGFDVSSQSLETGFAALKQYDFFLAKKVFTAKLKKNPVPAHFGLAQVRYDRLNHFHSLDSAYVNMLKSDSAWKLLSPSKKLDLLEYGISDSAISGLTNRILDAAFIRAKQQNTPSGYAYFRSFFKQSTRLDEAYKLEMARAYFLADSLGKSDELKAFLSNYPEAIQKEQALRRLDDVLFLEETKDQSREQFAAFITKYPASTHKGEAEDALYALMAPQRSRETLYEFVKAFPKNRNADEAWDLIYADFTSDQRVESFEAFKKAYPEYPYPDRLNRDFNLAGIKLYPAVQGELWGFVDSTGKVVLSYQYEEVWSFSENLAMVRFDGKVGYINKAGIRVVQPIYNDGEPFHNQLAVVEKDGLYGIIDQRGKVVLPLEYEIVDGPDNGFYIISKGEFYGFADTKGNIIQEPVYENMDPFSEGLAAVTKEGLTGFVDTTGKLVIPFLYEDVILFENGRVRVMKNDRVGLIDQTGKEIISLKNDRIGKFQEGLARVSRDGKCAFYDLNGKEVIPFQPTCSSPILGIDGFSEGLARVEKKGKKGYINRKGKLVIPMEWEESGYFIWGRAPFKKKNRWGYLTTQGKVAVEAQFDEAYPFVDSRARVKKKGKFGLVSTDGTVLLPFEWDELQEDAGWYIGVKNGKQVLMDSQLIPQSEVIWDEIRRTSDKAVFQFTAGSKMVLYHTGMKKIFWEEH